MRNAGSLVDERYAKALLDMTVNVQDSKKYAEELGAVLDTVSASKELVLTLASPNIKVFEKKAVLKSIFSGKVQNNILNFLYLLVDKDRIGQLEGIYRQFLILQETRSNILRMKIYLAFPVPEEQITEIRNKYRDLYGAAEVKAEIEIDKSLLGGVKIQIGDKVIDDSVKGKLEGLKKALSV